MYITVENDLPLNTQYSYATQETRISVFPDIAPVEQRPASSPYNYQHDIIYPRSTRPLLNCLFDEN